MIGSIKHRREGDTRSRNDANCKDIIEAMRKLDKAVVMPIFAVPSHQLHAIPRSHPEELHSMSVVERLYQMESKISQCQELIDNTVGRNIHITERMDKLEQNQRPSYSSVANASVAPTQPFVFGATNRATTPATPVAQATSRSTNRTQVPDKPTSSERNDDPLNNKPSTMQNRKYITREQPQSTLSIPQFSAIKGGSIDNIDTISMKSGASDYSGYQYQRQYIKTLQRPKNKSRVVTGTNVTEGSRSAGFQGAPEPDRHLFIYRVRTNTTDEDISNFMKENDIVFREIACLSNPNAKYKSFKLTVAVTQYDQLFNDNLWPRGVRVRPYITKNISHHDG